MERWADDDGVQALFEIFTTSQRLILKSMDLPSYKTWHKKTLLSHNFLEKYPLFGSKFQPGKD